MFAVIMAGSYTAYLVVFLTADRSSESFESVEELAENRFISYGAVSGGSTIRFFRESTEPIYQKMWAAMQEEGERTHARSNDEGVYRVKAKHGRYAFFMESVVMEYRTNRDCSIKQVGGLLDSKDYGIALPKGSPYQNVFDQKILNMTEDGMLQELKDKWWKTVLGE